MSIYRYPFLLLIYCNVAPCPSFSDADHYGTLANDYDRLLRFQHIPTINLINHHIPVAKTDQIVDIGGGTGEVLYLLRKKLGIQAPGVCVEPSENMLRIAAKKEGIVPVLSTAEEFLAKKPDCSMKFVLLNGVVHYFKDLSKVIGNLAKYMIPEKGTCLITQYPLPKDFWVEAGIKKYSGRIETEYVQAISEPHGLQCVPVEWKEAVEIEKELWYEGLRQRYASTLDSFSDEEIAEGICELELKFASTKILKFEVAVRGWILKQA